MIQYIIISCLLGKVYKGQNNSQETHESVEVVIEIQLMTVVIEIQLMTLT